MLPVTKARPLNVWFNTIRDHVSRMLRRSRGGRHDSVDADFVVPANVRGRLLRTPPQPLMDSLHSLGRGRPGITRESDIYWVVRDRRGQIIGGAKADVVDASLVALDVEIAPDHRRRGHATALYAAISEAGIDVEAASDVSLREGLMTPLGYAFQVGRRRKRQGVAQQPTTKRGLPCEPGQQSDR